MHVDVCLDAAVAATADFYLKSLQFDFIEQKPLFFPLPLPSFQSTVHLKENTAPLLDLLILIWLNLIWKTSPASFFLAQPLKWQYEIINPIKYKSHEQCQLCCDSYLIFKSEHMWSLSFLFSPHPVYHYFTFNWICFCCCCQPIHPHPVHPPQNLLPQARNACSK